MNAKKAIILDRDGTLNEDLGYEYKIKDFELLPGVIEGLNLLKDKYIFFIITNQSGIGKGFYSVDDFWQYTNHLTEYLKKNNIYIEQVYFCPHTKEENCECRKPNTIFVNEIQKAYRIDLKKSWVIGDHPSDVMLGINSGTKTIYLITGHGKKHLNDLEKQEINPTYIAKDFLSAAKFIKSHPEEI
ncbi:MAG: HAD-IIIA family hydrolase [Candidatus Lokiarchaeota archaeon]|nr:HAD-IIIA family hydrolase [Candidatus Lokiarchaeota archaeon]MBD3200322.1 HAD-IIIA family hydrolase [Candidatus Lokiarchaeota archaeon]